MLTCKSRETAANFLEGAKKFELIAGFLKKRFLQIFSGSYWTVLLNEPS